MGCGVGKWGADNTPHRKSFPISKLEIVSGAFVGGGWKILAFVTLIPRLRKVLCSVTCPLKDLQS